MRRLFNILITFGSFLCLFLSLPAIQATAAERHFTLVNLLVDGTKIWLPSSILVQEGDEVTLTLINKLDDPHGFRMEVFGIEEVVQPHATMMVKFTAREAGLYAYICHMHPPHIGGQILVVKK